MFTIQKKKKKKKKKKKNKEEEEEEENEEEEKKKSSHLHDVDLITEFICIFLDNILSCQLVFHFSNPGQ
jgi:hypothetical protein